MVMFQRPCNGAAAIDEAVAAQPGTQCAAGSLFIERALTVITTLDRQT